MKRDVCPTLIKDIFLFSCMEIIIQKKHSWHHRHHFMNPRRINMSGIKNTFLIRPAHFVCKKRAWQHTKFRILNDQQNIKHKQIQITSSKICFVCVHRCSNRIKNGTVLFPATAVLVIFQYTFIYVILRSAAIKRFTKKKGILAVLVNTRIINYFIETEELNKSLETTSSFCLQ